MRGWLSRWKNRFWNGDGWFFEKHFSICRAEHFSRSACRQPIIAGSNSGNERSEAMDFFVSVAQAHDVVESNRLLRG